MGKLDLSQLAFLEIEGQPPSAAESAVPNARLCRMVEHGMSPASAGAVQRSCVSRRRLLLLAAAAAAPDAAWAQAWPSAPIRLVVPFGAGSATDVLARELARALARELGQPVNVDNKPGGAAIIGADAVAKSAPNGYTLLLASSQSHATNSSLFRTLPYDPVRDFAPVARVSVFPAVLAVRSSIPAATVAELVAYAKRSPRSLNYASAGLGSQAHLQGAMLTAVAGLHAEHIPFKDAGQIVTAFVRGDLDFMFYPYTALQPLIHGGHVRLLATTSVQRNTQTRGLQTMAEAGFPEVMLAAWNALYVPAATPEAVVERLSTAALGALEAPDLKARFDELGVVPWPAGPKALADFTLQEINRYRRLVAMTGMKAE